VVGARGQLSQKLVVEREILLHPILAGKTIGDQHGHVNALAGPREGGQELAALAQDIVIERVDSIGVEQAGVESAALARPRKALVKQRNQVCGPRAMEIGDGGPLRLLVLKSGDWELSSREMMPFRNPG